MDYEKSDLDHAEIIFHCPACGAGATALACELERHPQVVCPQCGCLHTINVEEKKDRLNKFFQAVKRFQNGEN